MPKRDVDYHRSAVVTTIEQQSTKALSPIREGRAMPRDGQLETVRSLLRARRLHSMLAGLLMALLLGCDGVGIIAGAPSVATDSEGIASPQMLTAKPLSASEIGLTWIDSVRNERGFVIARSLVATGGFAELAVVGPNTTIFTDAGLSASTTYYYRVAAQTKSSLSQYSNMASATTLGEAPGPPDTTAPAVPSGLAVAAPSCSQASLSWNPSTDTGGSGLRGYNVYRNGAYLRQVAAPATSASDSGLAASTSYSYAISAVDNAGNESARSAAVSVTTPACPDTTAPAVPSGLAVAAPSCSQASLSWSPSTDTGGSGLRGYNIYRNGAYLRQVAAPATSASDNGLAASTSYSYAISALDNAGNESARSAAVGVTTLACPDTTAPAAPSGLAVAAPSCSQASLSWSPSTDTGGSGLRGYN
ncbi:MAG: hypothetical protein V2A73_11310, partial [Pseudomonadota bacterium]